jgi:hypothetical protein
MRQVRIATEMTARKQGLVGWEAPSSEGGSCTRWSIPERHAASIAPLGLSPRCRRNALDRRSACSKPVRWTDELGSRCIWCAGWLDLPADGAQLRLDVINQRRRSPASR